MGFIPDVCLSRNEEENDENDSRNSQQQLTNKMSGGELKGK